MSTTFRLSALQFLQNAVYATSVISLGTYLLQTLDFSGREVGMIYATNAIAATVAPPLVGWLADRHFSADRMLAILNVLAAIAITACFYATTFTAVYGLILAFNLFFMPTFGLLASICFHQLDSPARSFPAVRAWGTVSFMLVGLGLSFFGVENSPWPLIAGGGLAALTTLMAFTLPRIPPQPGFNFSMLTGPEAGRIIREPGMIVLLLAMLLSCIPSSFYYSFVNPFLNEVGWSAAAAKMSLGQFFEIGILFAMPYFFRKIRFRKLFFWGLFAWGFRYFLFSFARPDNYEFLLYLGIAVQGVAFVWIVIAAQIYVDNRVPKALRSTAQGLVSFANQGVGVFIGSWVAGEVVLANTLSAGGHDWSVIWLVPGVVGVLSAFGFWMFFPKASKL
ncbi:MFS transporter [Neolewinella aurantiaca]|uniref:MFS transporter n=1 Tax=Neolewinella aurantiaca TaxID=2602767 RepID=A0A5C7FVC9_9BACT|nr:MFS transporter [Neolewinella aurantiaca]TXF88830.1 MFS transporter [Neolewinella aurantiaca]